MLESPTAIHDREPHRRPATHLWVGVIALGLLLATPVAPRSAGQAGIDFTYKGHEYVMDPYSSLFGTTPLGLARKGLFEGYVKNSVEGQARAKQAGTTRPEGVWAALDDEERTTFLAVTAAAGTLTDQTGATMLSWFTTLDEIHGSERPFGGGGYPNDKAFRIYVRLTGDAVTHVLNGNGTFTNACTQRQFGYGDDGSQHPDYCRKDQDFDQDGKTDNAPNIQINVSRVTGCADVDLDYDVLQHLSKGNSNVLVHPEGGPLCYRPHLRSFVSQYCDPGFRHK